MSARHQAPRRAVTRIERTSGYGTTRYYHHLECGHIDIRRREATSRTLGCPSCLVEQRAVVDIAERLARLDDLETWVNEEVSVEVDAARLRAGLAALLRVDLDDVVMHTTPTDITGASVWISRSSLESLRQRLLTS